MKDTTKKRKISSTEDTKIFKKYALEALKKSYLTGVPAVIESKGTNRKIAKIGILIFCFTGFMWQSCLFLNLYYQYPTITVTGHLKHMLKPALTICDKNLISRRYFCERFPTFCDDVSGRAHKDPRYLKAFCVIFPPFCENKNDIYLKVPKKLRIDYFTSLYDYNFVKESGFQIKECLVVCRWTNISMQKPTESCSEPTYVRVLNKQKYPGACYTLSYNSNPNSQDADILNPQANLVIVLRWRNSDLTNIASNVLSRDYVEPRKYYISFHDPSRLSNPYLEGISVRDFIHYKVKVSQINNIRLPAPFSIQCIDYRNDWKRNGAKGSLTKEECYQNCHFEEELKQYGCVTFKVNYPHKEKLCLKYVYHDPKLDLKIQTCQERCKDACFYQTRFLWSKKTEMLDIPERYVQRFSAFLLTPENQNLLKYLNASSAVTIQVSFDISNSKEYKTVPKFEGIEIFSYLGSYLSIWLGSSCISVFDFIEIFTRIFLFLCKKMQSKSKFKRVIFPL